MKVSTLSRIPRLALVGLWLAYILLGWYLSFYNIFWFVGAVVVAISLALSWKSLVWLERIVEFSSTGALIILAILLFCLLLALATTLSTLIPILVIPLVVTFWANVEMRFAGFTRFKTFLWLAAIAGIGLALGETIDLLFLSSTGY